MTIKVDILLTGQSTGGTVRRSFAGQDVEIAREAPTRVVSVDGHVSVGNHPTRVHWRGGAASQFAGVNTVDMVDAATKADVLHGELNTTFTAVRDKGGGVRFDVL
jgi:hypothetical protein